MDNIFEIKGSNPEIEIRSNMKPGLYRFYDESASGKTWLAESLKTFGIAGQPVLGYGYDDYYSGSDFRKQIKKELKIVVLDRYDMFNGEFSDEIIELSNRCIVLLDCKRIPKIPKYAETAFVKISDNNIIVSESEMGLS